MKSGFFKKRLALLLTLSFVLSSPVVSFAEVSKTATEVSKTISKASITTTTEASITTSSGDALENEDLIRTNDILSPSPDTAAASGIILSDDIVRGTHYLKAGVPGYAQVRSLGNQYLSVYTTGSTNTYIEVFADEACTKLIASSDNDGHGKNAQVYFFALAYQPYYIKVKGASAADYGPIDITIQYGQPNSGYEKDDMFEKYNNDTYQRYNNCYTYALSYYVHPRTGNLFRRNGQNPGEMSGSPIGVSDLANATIAKKKIEEAMTKDFAYFGGDWKEIKDYEQPREGYFKVALVLAPGMDYHWYRQVTGPYWVHKLSTLKASYFDASDEYISNPQTCDKDHTAIKGPNYTDFIAYYEFKIPDGAQPTMLTSSSEEVVYPIKDDLTIEMVTAFNSETTEEEVMEVLGEPHSYLGSGMIGSVYNLVDGTEIVVYFTSGTIDQIRIYNEDGTFDILVQ